MKDIFRLDAVSRPALLLAAGRAVGCAAAFAVPVVLARTFDQREFGTYKQLFLVYATLYGLVQLGMAESLYYFVPRQREQAGRYVCNALVTLALTGAASVALLSVARKSIADWLSNPLLAEHVPLLGLFVALMLISAAFEIVLISRKRHVQAAVTYVASDIARTLLFIVPALTLGSLHAVLVGAVTLASLRVVAMLVSLWREFGRELRVDPAIWRLQLAYAIPFAAAVAIEIAQVNFHQYVVASRFDAATFAIYAVGCLQIPLVDLIAGSTYNVMMVQMAEDANDGDRRAALALWHSTICWLALLIFPLTAFLLVMAREVIVVTFTSTYLASAPIFMLWSLTILPSAFAVDSVLRVYGHTRFLLVMNLLRLTLVVLLIGWFLSAFGLYGAVLVTLLSTLVAKGAGVVRIARLLGVGLPEALPWKALALIAVRSSAAAVPAFWIGRSVLSPAVALASGAAAYGAVYALLCYASVRSEPTIVPVRLELLRRISAWLLM